MEVRRGRGYVRGVAMRRRREYRGRLRWSCVVDEVREERVHL